MPIRSGLKPATDYGWEGYAPHATARVHHAARRRGGAWPLAARAQQPSNLLRVGTVSFIRRSNFTWAAFERRMRELGYIEGQNFAVEFINAKDHVERIGEAARDLSRRKVDIGLADSHLTLKSIMAAMSTSPIVFIASNFDPVALGFVASIARPGGNLTGIYVRRPELVEKQIGMLARVFSGKDSVGCALGWACGRKLPGRRAGSRCVAFRASCAEARKPAL